MAKVSVILAVKDGGQFLVEAISSVLNQTFGDFEVVVVDDGSSDRTPEILEDFNRKDKRVRVFRNAHTAGLTKSLNFGLSVQASEWIARIDHDDVWLPDKLSKQMEYVENNSQIVLLGTWYKMIDLQGTIIADPDVRLVSRDKDIRAVFKRYNPFFHSSVLFSREVYQLCGGYDESFRYAQDYEYWGRIMSYGSAHILPEVLALRRLDKHNISIKKQRRQKWNAIRAKIRWLKEQQARAWEYGNLLRDLGVMLLPIALKDNLKLWFRKGFHFSDD